MTVMLDKARATAAALLVCAVLCTACSFSDDTPAANGGSPSVAVRRLALGDGFPYGTIFRISHTAAGAADLTNFQVRVQVDTATEITAGRMRSDCADIRAYAGDGCNAGTPANFWVADGTCNTSATDVWLGLPSILAGSVTSFAIYWGVPNAASASNGTAVFPIFFDDFNDGSIDGDKWNLYGSHLLSESNGKLTTAGGASALWTKQKVMTQGQTVFGVRTNAQSAGGADIEYGASTLITPGGPGNIHWGSRIYSGAIFMAWEQSEAYIGNATASGFCAVASPNPGARWTNAPGDNTWFQTEFFYEWVANDQTRFGIYDKFGVKRQVTLGSANCKAPMTESAYYQFDHSDGSPNPSSSLDYAYVRKFANPDPLITNRTDLSQALCLPNGQGPCTPANAATVCASGACSPNASVCIPPLAGACYVDADCGNGQFCNGTNLACSDRLAPGTPLPNDGVHGSCSAGNTNAYCTSGFCNPTTSTCASSNGATCQSAAYCVSNVCDSDSKCGYASGGSCTPSTSSVCRSTCGATGVCLPPNGCDQDTACSAAQHCSTQTYGCIADLSNGAAIPADHGACGAAAGSAGEAVNVCSSGKCNALSNTCADANGGSCSTAQECESGVCAADSKCGYANGSGPCTALSQARVCRSQRCNAHDDVCVPDMASTCWVDADCSDGQFCHRATFTCSSQLPVGASVPTDSLHNTCQGSVNAACASGLCNAVTQTCAVSNSGQCSSAADCTSNVCSGGACGYADGAGSCTVGQPALQCRSGVCGNAGICIPNGGCSQDDECDPGEYCVASSLQCAPALANGFAVPDGHGNCAADGGMGSAATACASGDCNPVSATCAGENGTVSCVSATQCVSNVCGQNGRCGYDSGEAGCTPQNAVYLCQSGTCSGTTSVCIPSGPSRCWADADCASGEYCHRSTFTCAGRLAGGAALPGDQLHNACPLSEVNAACASGSCNRTTNTCASALTSACTEAAECVSNVCDDDGNCGYADGHGPCSVDTATSVCRSGVCNTTGLCIPAGGCANDSDCSADRHCRLEDFACALDLGNGSLLPSSHGACEGTGPAGAASAVCESGVCNPFTNTCAGVNTDTTCTSALECKSNVCGLNGRCGLSDGAGSSCTQEDAAALCQSGACSPHSGLCVPEGAGKCWADADCAADEFCHRETFTCSTRLPATASLPEDSLHESCPAQVNAACTSGLCNSVTHTCAVANGEPCTAAEGCTNNVCDDGVCGYEDGGGSCARGEAAPQCRSGVCGNAGICIPNDGCSEDAECDAGEYCVASTLQCATALANGFPIPDGHGSCTASGAVGSAATACASGKCNALTDTCAGENTDISCSSAAQCISNLCGENGRCGRENGAAPCTTDNAADVCQSGSCSASANVCIPGGAGQCWADADCGEGQYCHRSGFECRPHLLSGSTLPGDQLHGLCPVSELNSACASGSCNRLTQTCAGALTAACAQANECLSSVCDSDGFCGYANGHGPCTADNHASVCRSGACNATGRCIPAGGCGHDADCPAAQHCREDFSCAADLQNGAALPAGRGACTGSGAFGEGGSACASGACNSATNTCAGANTQTTCSSAVECSSNVCGSNGRCGFADGGDSSCTPETAAVSCQSGVCSAHGGVCIPEGDGKCWVDQDCDAEYFCHRATMTCQRSVGPGTPLPDDGLHESCDAEGRSAACETGRCDPDSQKCVAENGASCSADDACVSHICGANERCGRPSGEGPCSSDDAQQVCQSGVCSPAGVCIEAAEPCAGDENCGSEDGEGPCTVDDAATSCRSGKCSAHAGVCISGDCWSDADCSEAQYCIRPLQSCQTKLANGEQIPNDGAHDSCQDGRSAACSSGLCDGDRCIAEPIGSLSGGAGCECNAGGASSDRGAVTTLLLLMLCWPLTRRRPAR